MRVKGFGSDRAMRCPLDFELKRLYCISCHKSRSNCMTNPTPTRFPVEFRFDSFALAPAIPAEFAIQIVKSRECVASGLGQFSRYMSKGRPGVSTIPYGIPNRIEHACVEQTWLFFYIVGADFTVMDEPPMRGGYVPRGRGGPGRGGPPRGRGGFMDRGRGDGRGGMMRGGPPG
ncbi:unnamed protein product, partial [Timema podura]|nr:unnamed protein product [Timema podura]